MELPKVWTIAIKELQDATRNRWFWLYTGAFAAMSLGLAGAALIGSGFNGMAGFGRTTASLINLIIMVVPLMGLTAGTQSLAGERERGTLAYLLAQPVSRAEVLAGKFVGQALALGTSLVLGFGLSGLILAWHSGPEQGGSFLVLLGLALLLAWTHLGLGFLLATLIPRAAAATGAAVILWLGLVFLGDLGLLGLARVAPLGPGGLLHLSLANPLQVFRMAAIFSLSSQLEVLGPAGIYAVRLYGQAVMGLFVGVLLVWTTLPMGLALALFRRRTLA